MRDAAETMEGVDGLSLVIPAFEEAMRLPPTLEAARDALPRLAREGEIVVVDDGSRDATAEVARRAVGAIPVRATALATYSILPGSLGALAAVLDGAEAPGRLPVTV